jgi:hypothetical protein
MNSSVANQQNDTNILSILVELQLWLCCKVSHFEKPFQHVFLPKKFQKLCSMDRLSYIPAIKLYQNCFLSLKHEDSSLVEKKQ